MNQLAFVSVSLACFLLATEAFAGHASHAAHPLAPATTPLVASPSPVPPAPPVDEPVPPPAEAPSPGSGERAVEVTFESRQDHVSLQAQEGPLFTKVCEAPCKTKLPAGTVLGLRHDGNTTLAQGQRPVVLTESVHVVGTYVDRTRVRIAGAALAAVSFVGGVAMVLDSGMSAGCFSDDDDDGTGCHAENSHPRPIEGLVGYTIALGGTVAGLLMVAMPNLARFEITPLQTASPSASGPASPESAILQRRAAQAEGVGLRIRF